MNQASSSFRERTRQAVEEFRLRFFVRSVNAGDYLESFLIAAVASVLVIRLFLELTNYPKIAGGGLHIAHLLWGGLLMCAALLVLLCLMGRAAEQTAAVLGGLGFGTFIDEIGKFITEDNDYFYRPAASLIYLTFVLLFLLLRSVQVRAVTLTTGENFINALREMEEVVMRDLDADERKRALALLDKSDNSNPLVIKLRAFVNDLEARPASGEGVVARFKRQLSNAYLYFAQSRWFTPLVVLFFLAQLVVKSLYVFILVFLYGFRSDEILDVQIIGRIAARLIDLSFVDAIEIACSVVSGGLVLWGVLLMTARLRLAAYKSFLRAMLIEIFIVQVFAFYKEQFSALLGLFINIMVYVALRFLIEQETRRKSETTETQ